MEALYQRLKELSKPSFESLIDHILQSKYPNAGIKKVEGAGGDGGIDHFSGMVSDGPAIWQDKHFPNGLKDSQRRQVKKSLAAALVSKPKVWTLCIPVDLTSTQFKWFEKLTSDYAKEVKIELMQASHIIHDLSYFKEIRESFFGDAVSDIAKLHNIATNTVNKTLQERAALADEYASQYLEVLKSKDPRFSYQLQSGRQRISPTDASKHGVIMSIFNGNHTINVFPRDVVALKRDPLAFSLELSKAAVTKFDVFRKTGKPQVFSSRELISFNFHTGLRDLFPTKSDSLSLEIRQNLPEHTHPVKVIFSKSSDSITYAYTLIRLVSIGSEIITSEISGGNMPFSFELELTQDDKSNSSFSIQHDFAGTEVGQAKKAYDALEILKNRGSIQVISLESDTAIISLGGTVIDIPSSRGILDFLEDLLVISKHFGVSIRLPNDDLVDEDYSLVAELKRMITGEWFDIDTVTFDLVKDSKLQTFVGQLPDAEYRPLRFIASPAGEVRFLFGTAIELRQAEIEIERAHLSEAEQTLKRYALAGEGETVEVRFSCNSRARFISRIDPRHAVSI